MNFLGLSLAYLVALLESVTYLGFIQVHTHIPAFVFYLISLLLLLRPTSTPKWFTRVLGGVSLFVSLLYFVLYFVESFTYDNYVFTLFHLNLKGLVILALVTLVGYQSSYPKRSWTNPLAAIIFLGVFNLSQLSPLLINSIIPIIHAPFASYDQKMTSAYPGFYPAMQMVSRLTREDSTIIIPPQGAPWVTEGNSFLVSRFLYPRQIVQMESETKQKFPSGNVYMLIAKGSWPTDGTYAYGWPKIPVQANYIWKFDVGNNTFETFSRDYDPAKDLWDWGLIKVQNE